MNEGRKERREGEVYDRTCKERKGRYMTGSVRKGGKVYDRICKEGMGREGILQDLEGREGKV